MSELAKAEGCSLRDRPRRAPRFLENYLRLKSKNVLLLNARLGLELHDGTRATLTKAIIPTNGTIYLDEYFNLNATLYRSGALQLRAVT